MFWEVLSNFLALGELLFSFGPIVSGTSSIKLSHIIKRAMIGIY